MTISILLGQPLIQGPLLKDMDRNGILQRQTYCLHRLMLITYLILGLI